MIAVSLTVCIVALLSTSVSGQFGEGLDLIAISAQGTLVTRVFCEERINCTGRGDSVFWALFGLPTEIPNTETRFTETVTGTDEEGEPVIMTTLVLSPVSASHGTLYQCQTQGELPFSVSLNVNVQQEALEIISEIPNIDISNETVGNNITVVCQVETCLSVVTMLLYKDEVVADSETISGNTMDSVSVAFTITVQENTAGKYACRAMSDEGSTPFSFFNITGVPIVPSISVVSTTTANNVDVVSTSTSAPSVSQGSTSSTSTSSSSRVVMATMSPSQSPGGASAGTVVEWTVMFSLLLVTLFSGLLVW